jgi:uncharacterized membrane protein YqaE (UPF0057 family)
MKRVQISLGEVSFFINLNTYKDLEKELKNKYNLYTNQYYITSRTRLIGIDWNFNKHNEIYYQVHSRMLGGNPFSSIGKTITNGFKPLAAIPAFFDKLIKVFKWLFYDLPKWLFTEALNPIAIINDAVAGIFAVLRIIGLAFLDAITGIFRYFINLVFEPIVSSFWGYTPKESEKDPKDKKKKNCGPDQRCYEQPVSKVAFPVLISTIILPPMGLFMELGLKGWMNLLICAILTLFYYFPGLIYALIILYC